ncbi:Bifunctional epoxide hydrolase [Lachnellula occidentalis]|uniref:Bifunctional epoxide hydrolase n=1 Tax=Lachnellula occidentalis TaxID=215460 RepID=A0A8H8UBD2_9HELO|nr:Bifunctional epoxide hydrolase [Lachnellula occidentalis]
MSPVPPNKTLTLLSGTTYAYHFHPSSNEKPTLLFLHGFPSTSHEWRHQLSYFSSRGYGILAPDLLGYGLSSKPLEVEKYLGSAISADIITILDHEGLTSGNVVGIGHDWGTYPLSQLAFRYPSYFSKFVFVSVPYGPPGLDMDVSSVNAATKEAQGYEQFGYWLFFTSPEAGKKIGERWESFFSIVYCEDAGHWVTDLAGIGHLEKFISADRRAKVGEWVGDVQEEARWHHEMIGDDYSAPLRWYHRGMKGLGKEEEEELLKKGEIKEKIGKETLMITGTKDRVCNAEKARIAMEAFVENPKENLKVLDLEAGHWVMLEKAEEMNRGLERFLENGVRDEGVAKSKV